MKKILFIIYIAFASSIYVSHAQVIPPTPEDALRNSWTRPTGTARNQALGGASVSLGGDITSLFTNPAGLGLYKTSELVVSPGLSFYGGKGDFRESGSTKADNLTRFNMGSTGFVFGNGYRNKATSSAFSFGINKIADFNGSIHYKGLNDKTSFSIEPRLEFQNYYNNNSSSSDAAIVDGALNDPNMSMLSKLGIYTYLLDIDRGYNPPVISRAENVLNEGPLEQENTITTKGGSTELAAGYAANFKDKFYIGGSIGFPIMKYNRVRTYTERDVSGNNDNDFAYTTYQEDYTSKGFGINLKFGIIYKPINSLRLGLAVQSPTWYSLTDNFYAKMVTDIEGLSTTNPKTGDTRDIYSGQNPDFNYDMRTPTKFAISATYLFHAVEDVTQQKGFITADLEYINHKWSKFKTSPDNNNSGDQAYYDAVTDAIKNTYKGTMNFRLGGEMKFNTIMARAGFSYFGRPYAESILKSNIMNFSGGLGYRDKGWFFDIAYVYTLNKDVNFPYYVGSDVGSNTYAELKNSASNIVATIGIKW